eukprot:543587_1
MGFIKFFGECLDMIIGSTSDFLSKSQKKIDECIKYKGKYIDDIESIANDIVNNVGGSQCHAERTIGVYKYIKFHNGRAYHSTVAGKTLWILNKTYEWLQQLKKK